jgi:hypothetical protein
VKDTQRVERERVHRCTWRTTYIHHKQARRETNVGGGGGKTTSSHKLTLTHHIETERDAEDRKGSSEVAKERKKEKGIRTRRTATKSTLK